MRGCMTAVLVAPATEEAFARGRYVAVSPPTCTGHGSGYGLWWLPDRPRSIEPTERVTVYSAPNRGVARAMAAFPAPRAVERRHSHGTGNPSSAYERHGGKPERHRRRLQQPRPPSNRVHQATVMVSTQAKCNLAEALDRLIERADATGKSLDEIAMDVLNGVIRFDL
jgi:hypothetical protein